MEMSGLKYSYYVNTKRKHGFNLPAEKLTGYMVIASDFEITRDEIKELIDNNVVVLSTDHHDCEDNFIYEKNGDAEGIVLNNQYPFEPEEDRYLSGAGVFYEVITSLYPDFKSEENEALVGVTLLSDVRQIENSKARKYLKTAYTINPSEGYIKYLIENVLESDFSFGVPRMDRNFIDYNFSPFVNALLRLDKVDDAVNFILGKGKLSYKGNPRNTQKDIIELMNAKASILELDSLVVVAVNNIDFINYKFDTTSFIGLLCSNVKDRYRNKSTLGFIYENGVVLRASFRGRCDDVHYKVSFNQLGLKSEGHPNAFGITDFVPTSDTWVQLNDVIMELEASHQETVKIVECSNMAMFLVQRGSAIATENCYVRDMYRTYIRYTGKNAKIVKETYKMEEFTPEDFASGTKPDKVDHGISYKYLRDENGNPIPKYREYLIDGRKVKSFGVSVEDGIILPVLEKGYIQLYLRSMIN